VFIVFEATRSVLLRCDGGSISVMRARPVSTIGTAVAVLVAAGGLFLSYGASPSSFTSERTPGLRQLALLYLDEPAPLLDQLDFTPGQPLLLIVCQGCQPPEVDAQVMTTADDVIAEAYALRAADGTVGPGYAVIDPEGHVRYRTFDPRVTRNADEIRVLVNAVR